MSRIVDSFKREIGKNTGKAVSNFLFGDSHSTPYRRVNNGSGNYHSTQNEKEEELDDLNEAVLDNADIVLQTKIPNDEDSLVELMSIWGAQLEITKWRYSTKKGRIHNQFSNALFEKYSQALMLLQHKNPNNLMINYYQEKLDSAKKRKTMSKVFSVFGFVAVLAIVVLVIILLRVSGVIYDPETFAKWMCIFGLPLIFGLLFLLV